MTAITREELEASNGSSIIGHILTPGAEVRTVADKLYEAVSVADFGTAGDGTTDDTDAIQAALDYAAAQGGGTVRLAPGGSVFKTTAEITGRKGVNFDMNGCKIEAHLTNEQNANDCGYLIASNSVLENGHIAVVTSANGAESTATHAAVRAGPTYGAGGSVNPPPGPSLEDDISNFVIRNMIVESNKDRGAIANGGAGGISIIGNIYNGLIENIVVPSNSKMQGAIMLDWGTRGIVDVEEVPTQAIKSLDTEMHFNRENFEAGDGFTTHPHDIIIRNVKIGKLTRPYTGGDYGTHGVRLSGCYGIRVESVYAEEVTQALLTCHAGDLGFEFARGRDAEFNYYDEDWEDARFGLKGISFRACFCSEVNNGNLIATDSTADNVQRSTDPEVLDPPYEPRFAFGATWPTDVVFEQVHGSSGDGSNDGIFVYNQDGGEIRECSATGFSSGLRLSNTRGVRVTGGRYSGNRLHGILLNDNAAGTLIKDIRECARNNQADEGHANVRIHQADGTVIDGGVYGARGGEDDPETASHCILSTAFGDGGKRTSLINRPTIRSHGDGAYALVMGSGQAWGTFTLIADGVDFGPNVTNRYVGQEAVPVERRLTYSGGERVTYEISGTGANLAGLVVSAGDRFIYQAPTAGGKLGKVCTTAGTIGSSAVLKEYGAINA